LIEHLARVNVSWTALALAVATGIVALFLRLLLPETVKGRGKLPVLFLFLSFLVRVIAVPIESVAITKGFNLASAFLLALGMTGIGGMLVFDLFLMRIGVRVPTILRDILLAIGFVIACFSILRYSGANLVSLVTTSAVLTAVIGLALQEPMGNMFAGLSMQLDRTISIGDYVKFNDRIGQVKKISFRATTLVTLDDDTVTVPNRYFMQHEVMNYSRPTSRHRMWAEFSFAYHHPPNDVKRALEEAIAGCPGVLSEPAPTAVVRSFGDHGINYTLLYWIHDFANDVYIDSDVRTRIWYAARRHNLEFPFPTRTIYMHEMTAVEKTRASEADYLDRLGALSKVELFGTLEDADVELLARGMRKATFAAGETLIRQGDPGDSLFLVSSGEVAVNLAVDGASRQVATLRAGDILGEASLLTGEPRGATCIATSDVVCHTIGHELFQQVMARRPRLAEDISAVLSTRQTALEAQREGLSAEAAAAREAEERKKTLQRIKAFFGLG
jgi:small-conductance mechanosensitive channel/CRP-like cAMP-binding protein